MQQPSPPPKIKKHPPRPPPPRLQLAVPAGDEAVLPGVVDMLEAQGRMKYLRPLYRYRLGVAVYKRRGNGKSVARRCYSGVCYKRYRSVF